MDWQRMNPLGRQRLVYRRGPAVVVGPLLILVGALAAAGTGQQLVQRGPENTAEKNGALLLGVLVSLALVAWGAELLTVRQVVLDPAAGHFQGVRVLFNSRRPQ